MPVKITKIQSITSFDWKEREVDMDKNGDTCTGKRKKEREKKKEKKEEEWY